MDLTRLLAAHRAGELDLERFCAVLIERLRHNPTERTALSDRVRALADCGDLAPPTRQALAGLLTADALAPAIEVTVDQAPSSDSYAAPADDRTVVLPDPIPQAGLADPQMPPGPSGDDADRTVVAPTPDTVAQAAPEDQPLPAPAPRRRSWLPIPEPEATADTEPQTPASPGDAVPPPAVPEPQPESDPATLKAKVEDAFLDHYLGGYRSVGKQDRTAEDAAGKQLDQMLGALKGVRDRRTARRVADGERLAPKLAGAGTRTPLKVGAVLKNRFVLEKELGAGGMGTVFRAVDRRKLEAGSDEPYVAIKLLNEELRMDAEAVRSLEREARRTQTLSHPNIINVFDFDRDGRHVYITMEFLDGQPLDRIIRRQYGAPPTDLDAALAMVGGIGRALAYAHGQNFVHADVKPSNVFLVQSSTIKVLDFGLAAAVGPPGTGLAEGEDGLSGLTPSYASPERLRGDPPTREDDIYALGCVAYLLLSGQHPFQRTPADKAQMTGMTVPDIPTLAPGQMDALKAALAFEPRDRTPIVGTFIADLCGERIGDGS